MELIFAENMFAEIHPVLLEIILVTSPRYWNFSSKCDHLQGKESESIFNDKILLESYKVLA